MARRRDKPERRPSRPGPERSVQRHFIKTLWRYGRWAIPLAAAGVLTYHLATRKPAAPQHRVTAETGLESIARVTTAGTIVFRVPKSGALCTGCHDYTELASREAQRLGEAGKRIRDLLPAQFPISMPHLTFNPAPLPPEPSHLSDIPTEPAAFYDIHENRFEVALQKHAEDPTDARMSLEHEFVHYLTTMPDHLLSESWAHATPLMADPRQALHPAFPNPTTRPPNRFEVGFLSRAATLAGKGTAPIEGPGGNHSQFYRDYQRILSPKDLEAAAGLWRRAYEEYARNDVFWDAVALTHRDDPHAVHDVLIAQALYARRDQEVLRQRTNEHVAEFARLLAQRGHEIDHSPLPPQEMARAVNYPYETRTGFHVYVRNAHPDWTRAQVEGWYYSGIHGLYCTAQNAINYASVPVTELRKTAKLKLEALEQTIPAIHRHLKEQRTKGEQGLAEGTGQRLERFEQREKDLRRAIKESHFIDLHER